MMGCGCGDETPIQYRYNDAGELEKSTDGGTTWQDATRDDTRNNSPEFPPPLGDDATENKCIAAAGMVALIKDQIVAQLTDDMSRYEIGEVIKDWVTIFIKTADPLQTIITVAANQIFALVIAVLKPALTDEVYNSLKCIFDCTMGDDVSFSTAQWQSVRSQIKSDIGGIAGVFFEHLVYLLGAGGLTNIARAGGATTGDCSDCECNQSCATIYDVICGIGHDVIRGDGWMQVTTDGTSWTGYQSICISTGDEMTGCYISHIEYNGVPSSANSGARWLGEPIWPCEGAIGHVTTNVPCNTAANTWLIWGGNNTSSHDTIKIFFSETPCP